VRRGEVGSDLLPCVALGPTSRLQLGMVEEESEEGCLYSQVILGGIWDRGSEGSEI
jgi:hypothetical protein